MASKRTELGAAGGGNSAAKKKTKKRKGKKTLRQTNFSNYLQSESLVNEFFLTENKNISFHWANWSKTCEFQKNYTYKDVSNELKLKKLNDELSELKKVNVWLKNKRGSSKVSLYDVYEGYLDNRLRATWFDREGILIAFDNEAGPYSSLANMGWFNKKIYAAFMYRKLLTNKIPTRGFRLGMSVPVQCKFDNSPLNTAELTLHQVSEFGVILKVHGKNCVSKITHSSEIQLEFDVTPFLDSEKESYLDTLDIFEKYTFQTGKSHNTQTISIDSSIMEKYNNDRNAKASSGQSFFFFVPYTELFKAPNQVELKQVFESFVSKIKDGLGEDLKKAA